MTDGAVISLGKASDNASLIISPVGMKEDAGSSFQNQEKTHAHESHRDHHYTLLVPNLATALP